MTTEAYPWHLFEAQGFPIDDHIRGAFELYIREVIRWNQKINLTSITEPDQILIKHILCSLTYLKAFNPAETEPIIDIGSGAGFPGLPIKIYRPSLSLTLLEPSQKRMGFLRHMGRLLALSGIEYCPHTLEEMVSREGFQGSFYWGLARGFGPLQQLIKKATPLLMDKGGLIVRKESDYLAEVAEAEPLLNRLGLKLEQVTSVQLTGYGREYYLLVFRKWPSLESYQQ